MFGTVGRWVLVASEWHFTRARCPSATRPLERAGAANLSLHDRGIQPPPAVALGHIQQSVYSNASTIFYFRSLFLLVVF